MKTPHDVFKEVDAILQSALSDPSKGYMTYHDFVSTQRDIVAGTHNKETLDVELRMRVEAVESLIEYTHGTLGLMCWMKEIADQYKGTGSIYSIHSFMTDLTKINEAKPTPPLFIIERTAGRNDLFMPRGMLCILAAGGGVGKSLLTLHLALSLVLNRETALVDFETASKGEMKRLKPVSKTGKVVLLYGEENQDTCAWRLKTLLSSLDDQRINDGRGNVQPEILRELSGRLIPMPLRFSAPEVDSTLSLSGSTRDHEGHAAAIDRFTKLREALEELDAEGRRNGKGDGFDLIVVDPLAQFGGPDFEVDNGEASRLMKTLEQLTDLNGNPTVLLIHHSPKTAKKSINSFRGASALKDNARWAGVLQRVGETSDGDTYDKTADGGTLLELRVAKQNYGATGQSMRYVSVGGDIRAPAVNEVLGAFSHEASTAKAPNQQGRAKRGAMKKSSAEKEWS